jgi:hypothetical protein
VSKCGKYSRKEESGNSAGFSYFTVLTVGNPLVRDLDIATTRSDPEAEIQSFSNFTRRKEKCAKEFCFYKSSIHKMLITILIHTLVNKAFLCCKLFSKCKSN